MKFGVFSDVHGDFVALMRVWSAMEQLGVAGRTVLNAGDSVGYGDDPEKCVQFLKKQTNIVSVRGNYDRHVSAFPERNDEYRKRWGRSRPEKYRAIKRDSETISDSARDWLADLPKEERLDLCGWRIVVCHYSPGSKEAIGRWTGDKALERIAAGADADIVVCGHTHTPFVRRAGDVLFLNPGTVGRTRGHWANYAVLDLETGQLPNAELMVA